TLYDPGVVEDLTGLAPEQEVRLKELLLTELMNEDCSCKLADADPEAWQGLVERVGGNLPGEGPAGPRLRAALRAGGTRMFEAIRQLEICLGARPIRAAVFKALNRIYHEAFLEPRLKSQSLVAVPLDPNFPQEKDIPSEIEIKGPGKPPQVLMGRRAQQNRRSAMALAAQPTGAESNGPTPLTLDGVRRLFHHSPKRYLGVRRSFAVPLDEELVPVTSDELVQAAWAQLIELTNGWRARHPTACSKGRFTRAVVTYPTVAPPSVRREVETLVRELKFPDVVTDYDEAVAAALFYLHREFGGSLDLGPEVFKARSRRDKNKWFQNVLVLDIGGGSTDLALLQLTLEEVDPFLPGESRGAGGRCYVITPRLLGSSGNTQLGGELISLRVFRLLKAALADRLLTAVQDKHLESAGLASKIAQLGEVFTDGSGRYRPGSIVDTVNDLPETDPLFTDALNAAEQVLPTRWRNQPGRLQAFYTLWEHAEAAKIQLGGRREPGAEPPVFELVDQEIGNILNQCGIAHTVKDAGALHVRLDAGQLERAAEPVIQEAVGIARGLLAGRLPRQALPDAEAAETVAQEPLDWLILSGKTCNLELVHQVIRQEFVNSPHFVWNPERVTFVPQYAKLAPSAGACYAEKMRRTAFAPFRFKEQLRKGLNQLTYNIDNLFFFLPCSFLVPVHNGQIEIFRAGQPLYRLDEQEVGKARSEPLGVRLLNAVMRRDFQAATPILWGSYDGMALARELEMPVPVFLNRIMMQFEVDYRLFMRIFLWDGPAPHYQLDPQAAFVDVADTSRRQIEDRGPRTEDRQKTAGALSPTVTAGWDISADVITAQTNSRPATILIAADQELTETFHHNGDASCRGLIVPMPDLFDETGKLMLHARPPGGNEWVGIGELPRPVEKKASVPGQERATEYPRRYHLTLDEHGVLRVHLGEVPYWKTEDLQDWKGRPGRVLQRDLELVEPPARENRDPFCGVH
ncbi:MAG: virulence factor SrfB, partial [Gemmataceae bacterium]|nr:virulence factor SrfB [Gemmataceae bacterium]